MPLVRIAVMKGKSSSWGKQVGEVVYRSMMATLNVPANDHFQIITEHDGESGRTQVTLQNTSSKVAFFIRLKLMRRGTGNESGEQVVPVLWEDNYVSLLPGETKQLTAKYKLSELHGAPPAVEVRGLNVARAVLD